MVLIQAYLRYLKDEKKRSILTLAAYEKDITQFCDYLRRNGDPLSDCDLSHRLLSVTPQAADAYAETLARQRLQSSSISRKLTVLRVFYAWLIRSGRLENNPFGRVKRSPSPLTGFSYIEPRMIQPLFEAIGSTSWLAVRDRAMLGLLFNTGMRVHELLEIQDEDILWDESIVRIHGGGKASRRCKLWGWVMDDLRHYDRLRRQQGTGVNAHFFVNCACGPLTSRSICRKFSAYGLKAGLPVPITPATLRHSYAMMMLQNGVRPKNIQTQLGHLSNSSMTHYLDCLKQTVSSGQTEAVL
jgi:integrase/recombinase XerC